jgi:nucleotidyltransferase substrate binding protein (TIGR01987 family)
MKRLEQVLNDLHKALKKLKNSIDEAKTDLEIDGVIQRFEFTYELLWKSLKLYFESEGIECKTPRACFKEAYKESFIEDEEIGLNLLKDRNLTVHIYNEVMSREIYERIKNDYVGLFIKVFDKIKSEISDQKGFFK